MSTWERLEFESRQAKELFPGDTDAQAAFLALSAKEQDQVVRVRNRLRGERSPLPEQNALWGLHHT